MNVTDRLDDMVLEPPNLIDRTEGLLKAAESEDAGVRFAIQRMDKSGRESFDNAVRVLERYGIPVYCRTQDTENIYFRVKKHQSVWAEYLLLKAGVELKNALIDPRNAQYTARRTPGWRRHPWPTEPKRVREIERKPAHERPTEPTSRQVWQGLNRSLNW